MSANRRLESRRHIIFVIAAFVSTNLFGDARLDLEKSLAGFRGSANTQVHVSVEMTRKSSGRFANSGFTGSAALLLVRPNGLFGERR